MFPESEHSKEASASQGYILQPFIGTWGVLGVSRLGKEYVLTWIRAKGHNPTSAGKPIGAADVGGLVCLDW
jgi:hypothetical protein